ncbi:MAG TPA: hypothetical protein VHV83_12850 [Armatimonadota bacterium]|nr:hypothetical protein [Armatimonadota bacterium]
MERRTEEFSIKLHAVIAFRMDVEYSQGRHEADPGKEVNAI